MVDAALARGSAETAAISGLGAAFFSACQAALRFECGCDFAFRISDLRIIIAAFAFAAAGFAPAERSGRGSRKRCRLRLDRDRHWPHRPLRLRAGRAADWRAASAKPHGTMGPVPIPIKAKPATLAANPA